MPIEQKSLIGGGIQYHKKIPIAQGLEIGNGLKFDGGEIQ